MSYQAAAYHFPPISEAGRQVAQLRQALAMVEQVAGQPASAAAREAAMDESARIGAAYEDALPIVQRRFDALAGETACWAAAAVEALVSADDGRPPLAAAACVAGELRKGLRGLARVLRV
jgi:hypothetical protein